MDMQNVSNLQIPEGEVRTIHDKDNRLLWGRVNYNVRYAGDTFQQSYSGKNLLRLEGTTSQGITSTYDRATGVLSFAGTISSTWSNLTTTMTGFNIPAGTLTFSIDHALPYSITVRPYYGSTNAGDKTITSGNTSISFTTTSTTTRILVFISLLSSGTSIDETLKLQLESGSSATSFEPYVGGIPSPNPDYPQAIQTVTGEQTVTVSDGVHSEAFPISLGSTELCKIGDYQDYIYKGDDGWYVHKEVGANSINVSEGTLRDYANADYLSVTKPTDYRGYGSYDYYPMLCSHAVVGESPSGGWNSVNGIGGAWVGAERPRVWIGFENGTTLETMRSTLSGAKMYYQLATPTDTKITDTTLISQLEAADQWLTRYGYNYTVSGSLPIIINRTNLS